MQTSQISSSLIARAVRRAGEPRWSGVCDAVSREAEAFHARGVVVPEFDASWYRPEVPWSKTYTEFHNYIFRHRPLFAGLRKQLLAGMVLGRDAWRRQVVECALGCGEAIDFRVTHADSGMEYSGIAWVLCDVLLGAQDLLRGEEEARITQSLRNAADAILRCREIWRTELADMAFSNHRICHLAVLMALGHVLKDESLVAPAYDPEDDRSFLHCLDGAVYDDGLCYESSLHYHYATTGFLCSAAQVQRALFPERTDFFNLRGSYGRCLRDYLIRPLDTCFSGMVLPRVGDCYGKSLRLASQAIFLVGYSAYNDALLGALASNKEEAFPLQALILGPDTPVQCNPPRVESRLFPEHGYALLRDDEGVQKQIFLTGDRSGIHHQRDGL